MVQVFSFFKKLPALIRKAFQKVFPALRVEVTPRNKAAFNGFILGVVATVIAIVMLIATCFVSDIKPSDTGVYTSYGYYGGDAYTGIQQAAADTSRNVRTQTTMLRAGLNTLHNDMGNHYAAYGMMLLIAGLGMCCYFSGKLADVTARVDFEAKVLRALRGEPEPEPEAPAEEPAVEEPAKEPAEEPAVEAPAAEAPATVEAPAEEVPSAEEPAAEEAPEDEAQV